MHKAIAILAGDGIGPEVMRSARQVLEVIAAKYQHQFHYFPAEIGGAAFDLYQQHCPAETLKICDQADAILLGSVGGPHHQQHLAKWQNCEVNSLLKLRKHFNFSTNIRPITVYPELVAHCPLKTEIIKQGVDFIIFRELTGGIYFGKHEMSDASASDECVYTEAEIAAVAHQAFNAAKNRRGKVCSVDKANVLATSKLWRKVITEVAEHYPEIELSHMLVDNCAMQLVLNPQQFDVIVTENLFGDILSDLAAALPGSLGLIPSASLNADGKGLYEPAGGSAPDIAGKGIANPTAQILSAAMMLRYSFGLTKEADAIVEAVKTTLASGVVTKDLDTKNGVGTDEFVAGLVNTL